MELPPVRVSAAALSDRIAPEDRDSGVGTLQQQPAGNNCDWIDRRPARRGQLHHFLAADSIQSIPTSPNNPGRAAPNAARPPDRLDPNTAHDVRISADPRHPSSNQVRDPSQLARSEEPAYDPGK